MRKFSRKTLVRRLKKCNTWSGKLKIEFMVDNQENILVYKYIKGGPYSVLRLCYVDSNSWKSQQEEHINTSTLKHEEVYSQRVRVCYGLCSAGLLIDFAEKTKGNAISMDEVCVQEFGWTLISTSWGAMPHSPRCNRILQHKLSIPCEQFNKLPKS